jgi:hypothetical protein
MHDEVLALPKNDADWFLVLDGERRYLTSADDKRGYAYHTAQVSAHLANDTAAVHKLEAAAPGPPRATVPVVEAITAEIKQLRPRQPEAAAVLEAYVRTLKDAGHDER